MARLWRPARPMRPEPPRRRAVSPCCGRRPARRSKKSSRRGSESVRHEAADGRQPLFARRRKFGRSVRRSRPSCRRKAERVEFDLGRVRIESSPIRRRLIGDKAPGSVPARSRWPGACPSGPAIGLLRRDDEHRSAEICLFPRMHLPISDRRPITTIDSRAARPQLSM